MKILLDESLPIKLKADFGPEHEVYTVRDKGWLGHKNGALLQLIVEDGFELFVTVDRNLRFQQNLDRLPITVAILISKDNRLQTLRNLIGKLILRLAEGKFNKIIEIT